MNNDTLAIVAFVIWAVLVTVCVIFLVMATREQRRISRRVDQWLG